MAGACARWIAALALCGTATLTASCGGSSPHSPSSTTRASATSVPPTSRAPTTTTAPALAEPTRPTGDRTLDASLTALARFVEHVRGHAFERQVAVALVDDATFRRRVLEGFQTETSALRREERVLKALELLPQNADYVDISRKLTSEEVIGFYDPDTQQLVVRAATLTPWARVIVVHELTHALDDQWFGLHRPKIAADDEQAFGFEALVEGSAERVRDAYLASRTSNERGEIAREEQEFGARIDLRDVPPSLIDLSESPYSLGVVLVDHLVAEGGVARLDAAFADPPRDSEQVLHPAKYDAHEGAAVVAVPATPVRPLDTGVLGEVFLLEVLRSKVEPAAARRAAEGWNGDRYALWDEGTRSCLRDDATADTAADLEDLLAALRTWRIEHAHADVVRLDATHLRLDACTS